MSLVSDASPGMGILTDIARTSININILPKIEDDLYIDDIVSILFLMVDDYSPHAFFKVFTLYCKAKKDKTSVIAELVKTNPQNWEDRLLESICICNNRLVIKKLGLHFEDLKFKYFPSYRLCSERLNPIAKCLYLLCESLSIEDTKKLLQLVKKDINNYNAVLEDIDHLELHLLYWMNIGYISIFSAKEGNLKNLLKHLKIFEELELIITDLKKCDSDRSTQNVNISGEASSLAYQAHWTETNHVRMKIRKISKGLCIIINQMYFQDSQYETRFGTYADSAKLRETFEGLGFTVYIFNDLKGTEILTSIRNLHIKFGFDYDCIFLCVLSHGYEGGIIAVDEAEISIESIDNAFCCREFREVIKIVIIQACQGKIAGTIVPHDTLTTDGLNDSASDITNRKHFCVFMSTLQGFVSIRDKQRGSWFIQELCNILQRKTKKTFFECVTHVTETIPKKRGIMDGGWVAQLPELRMCRLDTDVELPPYNS